MLTPQLIGYFGSTLLEGPQWIEETSQLLFVSIEQQLIYLYDVDTGFIKSFRTNGPVGCAVYKGEGILWSAEMNGVYETNIHTGARRFLVHPEQRRDMRYNDGALDHAGRFIFGTMGNAGQREGAGKLYSYDGTEVRELISGVTISNGIAFSSDYMYYIDTPTKRVARYRYCHETGQAIFEKYVIELSGVGLPDGMCIDEEGYLWIAEWEGGKIGKWDPDSGKLVVEVHLPCSRVTSCALGGHSAKSLYVTTAYSAADEGGLGGGLFCIQLN